jgi:TatD DNase family protein
LGIGGPVTFKNAQDRQEVVRQLPLSSILIETDAPYLAPHPHRGQRNEPGFVSLIADQIALLKQIPTSEVVFTTAGNANRLFEWRNRS